MPDQWQTPIAVVSGAQRAICGRAGRRHRLVRSTRDQSDRSCGWPQKPLPSRPVPWPRVSMRLARLSLRRREDAVGNVDPCGVDRPFVCHARRRRARVRHPSEVGKSPTSQSTGLRPRVRRAATPVGRTGGRWFPTAACRRTRGCDNPLPLPVVSIPTGSAWCAACSRRWPGRDPGSQSWLRV